MHEANKAPVNLGRLHDLLYIKFNWASRSIRTHVGGGRGVGRLSRDNSLAIDEDDLQQECSRSSNMKVA